MNRPLMIPPRTNPVNFSVDFHYRDLGIQDDVAQTQKRMLAEAKKLIGTPVSHKYDNGDVVVIGKVVRVSAVESAIDRVCLTLVVDKHAVPRLLADKFHGVSMSSS